VSLINNLEKYSKTLLLSTEEKNDLNSFFSSGFPNISDEEWKYTSLNKIVKNDFVVEDLPVFDEDNIIDKVSLGFKNKIVFLNGKLVSSPKIDGVTISDFKSFKSKTNNSILSLNSSMARNGFSIDVENNTVLNSPIEILFLISSTSNTFLQYRNQINLGKNSNLKIIENIHSLDENLAFINHFTQVKCDENSIFEYNKTQNNKDNFSLIDTCNIYQESNTTSSVNTLIFGGSFIRNNLNFEQNGENAESNMNGVSVLSGSQFADNHTFVDHKKSNCRSNEVYKGIYLDKSKGVFNGKIMVRPESQKIDAFQSNNNLLLSDESTIDTKPQLEIYADDVKCSHGCTIGQLDKEALFYMKSRGLAEKEAKALLTYAFTNEAIDKISVPEFKDKCEKLIAEKLNVKLDFNH